MIQTNYTLNDTDYYDTENSSFVIYREKLILTDDVIVNDNSMSWNCYVQSVNYIKKTNLYKIVLKIY